MKAKQITISPSVAYRDNEVFEIFFHSQKPQKGNTSTRISWQGSSLKWCRFTFINFNSAMIGALTLGFIGTRLLRSYDGNTKILMDEYANTLSAIVNISGAVINDKEDISKKIAGVFNLLLPTTFCDISDIENYLKDMDLSSLGAVGCPFKTPRKNALVELKPINEFEKFNAMSLFEILDGYLRLEREIASLKA